MIAPPVCDSPPVGIRLEEVVARVEHQDDEIGRVTKSEFSKQGELIAGVGGRVARVDDLDGLLAKALVQRRFEQPDVVALLAIRPVEGVAQHEDPERFGIARMGVVAVVEPELVGLPLSVSPVARMGSHPEAQIAVVGVEAVGEDQIVRDQEHQLEQHEAGDENAEDL